MSFILSAGTRVFSSNSVLRPLTPPATMKSRVMVSFPHFTLSDTVSVMVISVSFSNFENVIFDVVVVVTVVAVRVFNGLILVKPMDGFFSCLFQKKGFGF